jgi:hypothetical protein
MNTSSASPPVSRASRRTLARGLALDVGLPVVAYYALHAAGASDWLALLAATLVAAARIVLVAVRRRLLNALALVMLIIYGVGLALTFTTGDVRFLVLKDSVGTGVLGILFLCFAVARHPLTLAATRTWEPERAVAMAESYRSVPAVRHGHFVASMVWGVGLLAEALLRTLLVFLLPISIVVGLSTVLMVVVIGSLMVWSLWYMQRVRNALAVQARPAEATSS